MLYTTIIVIDWVVSSNLHGIYIREYLYIYLYIKRDLAFPFYPIFTFYYMLSLSTGKIHIDKNSDCTRPCYAVYIE